MWANEEVLFPLLSFSLFPFRISHNLESLAPVLLLLSIFFPELAAVQETCRGNLYLSPLLRVGRVDCCPLCLSCQVILSQQLSLLLYVVTVVTAPQDLHIKAVSTAARPYISRLLFYFQNRRRPEQFSTRPQFPKA